MPQGTNVTRVIYNAGDPGTCFRLSQISQIPYTTTGLFYWCALIKATLDQPSAGFYLHLALPGLTSVIQQARCSEVNIHGRVFVLVAMGLTGVIVYGMTTEETNIG